MFSSHKKIIFLMFLLNGAVSNYAHTEQQVTPTATWKEYSSDKTIVHMWQEYPIDDKTIVHFKGAPGVEITLSLSSEKNVRVAESIYSENLDSDVYKGESQLKCFSLKEDFSITACLPNRYRSIFVRFLSLAICYQICIPQQVQKVIFFTDDPKKIAFKKTEFEVFLKGFDEKVGHHILIFSVKKEAQ